MADNSSPPPDQKVKELVDAATRAELERWFGMPSFERLSDAGVAPPPAKPEDPEILEVRKKRAEALAAVDPALIEAHRKRTDVRPDLIKFKATIDVHIDPDITMFDYGMVERQHTVSEPIEREIPEALRDDLQDRTPQALLRDLHRPELDFEKRFEIQDHEAERRVDAVTMVAEVMKTRWAFKLGKTPLQEARDLIHSLRDDRHRPWTELKLPNRRVSE